MSLVMLTACSPASADVCEERYGIMLKWVPPQQSFVDNHPELEGLLNNPSELKNTLQGLGFSIKDESNPGWAFRCDRKDVIEVVSADYALAAPGEDYQEGYMIGYGANGEIVAIANRFNYRAP
jgi:hypothetical protein